MEVSIIIPVLNQKAQLKRVVEALNLQSFNGEVEIIVVDNGSDDGTYETAQKLNTIAILEKTYQTPYVCRNTGMRRASGDFIFLLDANCIPFPNFISSMLSCLGTEQKIVKGILHPEQFDCASSYERFDFINSEPRVYDPKIPQALPGNALAFPKFILDLNGFFISHIRSLADIEWTNRAYKTGIKLALCPKAMVSYKFKSYRPLMKKGRRTGSGVKERWFREHKKKGWKWPFFVAKHFFPPSPSFAIFLKRRNKMDGTKLSIVQILLIAWLYKCQIGIGLIFAKIAKVES